MNSFRAARRGLPEETETAPDSDANAPKKLNLAERVEQQEPDDLANQNPSRKIRFLTPMHSGGMAVDRSMPVRRFIPAGWIPRLTRWCGGGWAGARAPVLKRDAVVTFSHAPQQGNPTTWLLMPPCARLRPFKTQRSGRTQTGCLCDPTLRLHEQGACAPFGQSDALSGGCILVDGGCRTYGSHQRRNPFAVDRRLPAPRPGGVDRLPEEQGHPGAAAHQLRHPGAKPWAISQWAAKPLSAPVCRCLMRCCAAKRCCTPMSCRC